MHTYIRIHRYHSYHSYHPIIRYIGTYVDTYMGLWTELLSNSGVPLPQRLSDRPLMAGDGTEHFCGGGFFHHPVLSTMILEPEKLRWTPKQTGSGLGLNCEPCDQQQQGFSRRRHGFNSTEFATLQQRLSVSEGSKTQLEEGNALTEGKRWRIRILQGFHSAGSTIK